MCCIDFVAAVNTHKIVEILVCINLIRSLFCSQMVNVAYLEMSRLSLFKTISCDISSCCSTAITGYLY